MGAATTGSENPGARPRRTVATRARALGIDLWFPAGVVAVTVVLSTFAISGSSLSIWSPTAAPDDAALVTGDVRPIRSDEWVAISPLKVGQVRAGFPSTRTLGLGTADLSDSWRPQLPARNMGAALFAPFNLPLVILPVAEGFALYWWLPFAACAIGLYAWLRLLGVGRGVSMIGALVTIFAPAAAWWSGWWCQAIAQAAVPCALLLAATRMWERRVAWGVGLAVLAGLAAAALPWSYQPWAISAALCIGPVTAVWGLIKRDRRRAFLSAAAIAGGLLAIESAVYFVHERSYYEALANTVYPGARREVGGGVRIGRLFSSLFPFSLADSGAAPALKQENLSEVSMGWTVTAPVAVLTAIVGRDVIRRERERILLWASILVVAAVSAWCLIQWPKSVATITLLTFSPAPRTAPFLGLAGTVALALLFATAERRERLTRALGRGGVTVVAVGTMFVAAWGATDFSLGYLTVSNLRIGATVLCIGLLVVLLFTRWRVVAVIVGVAFAVVSGALVNPVTKGLGALTDSAAAATVRRLDDRHVAPARGTWAADDIYADALLNGQGVDSLSSYNDPVDEQAWRVVDPRRRYESAWNRFGYIVFDWHEGQVTPVVANPASDVITVTIDPCDPRLTRLDLRVILSSRPLRGSCLTPLATVRWHGNRYAAYRVRG